MSTVQAWLSVVNQLTELGKLHEEYRQHVDTQQTEAALLVMNPVRFMRALGAHISSNALQLAKASCGSAECEEIVSKVPQALGRACLVELSDQCSAIVLSAALCALRAFIAWCDVNGLFPKAAKAAQQPPASTSRAALGASVMQQLQDVGVPQHVVDASFSVFKQLSAQPASAATSSLDSSAVPDLLCLSRDLLHALWMFPQQPLQAEGSSLPAGPSSAVSFGCGLSLAVLGCADRILQPNSQQQAVHWTEQHSLSSSLDTALQYLKQLLMIYERAQGPAAQHALPSTTRACGVLAVLNLYSDRLKGLPLPAVGDKGTGSSSGGSSSGGGGSSSSQRSGSSASPAAAEARVEYQGASDEWVWQVASTNLQHLPDVAPALAKCIGLSKLQLACIAAHTLRSDSAVDMAQTVKAWAVVACAVLANRDERQAFKVVEGLAQLELSSLLLEWVAASDSSKALSSDDCQGVILAVAAVFENFTETYMHEQPPGAPRAGWQLMRLLERWADGTVPVLLQVMRKMLCRAQAAAAAAVAGAPEGRTASSNSSSSSSSSSSGAGDSGVGSLDELQALHLPMGLCVRLLAELSVATTAWIDRGADPNRPGYGIIAVWLSCGVEVVSLLEGYVRLLLSLGGAVRLALNLSFTRSDWVKLRSLLCKLGDHWEHGLLLMLAKPGCAGAVVPSGSDGLQQDPYLCGFMSLLVSTLKLAGSDMQGPHEEGVRFCVTAACACVNLLSRLCASPLGGAAATAVTKSGVAADSSSVVVPQQPVAACLPWLVLLGRCFFHIGAALTTCLQPVTSQSSAACGNLADTPVLRFAEMLVLQSAPKLERLLGSQQLAAAGYTLQPVQEQQLLLQQVLQDRAAALGGAVAAGADSVQGVLEFAQQLCAFGLAASSIPVPDFCNNPDCVTARGQSEAELVSGRSWMCGKCRVARYCGRDCQRAHWAQHKPTCQALAAVAVAASGGN